MSLSDSSIKRPKTVLIFTLVLIALGLYTTRTLPIDTLPDMSLPYVIVITSDTNASPEEIESRVTKVLEGTFSGISGLKKVYSDSSAGTSMIMLEFTQSTDLDQATNMVRDRLDLVRNYLPDEASSPMIIQMDPSLMPIMGITLVGERSQDELLDIAQNIVQPGLEQLDGVAQANISGGREKAILIDVPLSVLEQYNLSLTQISQALAAQNLKSDAGQVTDHGLEYTLSSLGSFTDLQQLRDTVVTAKTNSNGESVQVKLGDIADIKEGYKDATSYSYINGQSGILFTLQKQSGTNSLNIAKAVRNQLKTLDKAIPSDCSLEVAYDTTDMVSTSINNVAQSALTGALLAVLVIFIFLRSLSSTLTISLTIPISLLITLGIMSFTGHTVNMLSLAGLALGVGMLVDNSIVILENIFSYRERGAKPHIAAKLGANEMSRAITSSTLTSICVFLPLLLFRNSMNGLITIFEDLAFTVIVSLTASLLVALILVPTLSASFFKGHKKMHAQKKGVDRLLEKMFNGIERGYGNFVRWALHHKFLLIAVIVALFVLSVMHIPQMGFELFSDSEQDQTTFTLDFPHGTDLESSNAITKQFEKELMDQIQGYKTISTSVGSGENSYFSGTSASTAKIEVTIRDSSERKQGDMTLDEVIAKARKIAAEYPQFTLSVSTQSAMSMSGSSSSDIDITVKCNDFDRLRKVSDQIALLLKEQGSSLVSDVSNSIVSGNPQLDLVFDRSKLALFNLTAAGVATELKADLSGTVVGSYSDKGDDIDMVLRLKGARDYHSINLDTLTVTNNLNQKVPLSAFASFKKSQSPLTIEREDQSRVAHVTATRVSGQSINTVTEKISDLLKANVVTDENLTYSIGGEWETMQEGIQVFLQIILMAAILVFAVMASQFESFKDPFIILFTLPLALIGVVGIETLMHMPISLMTLVGALVLVGIIVNNGIVLVDYTNLLRKRGEPLEEACINAARSRLRPVSMTTLTTVLALVPMAFFPQTGAELVQPIGQTVFGGLTFGTLMTLTLMPVVYYLFNVHGEKKRLQKERERKENAIQGGTAE
ncbi:MAG: efflux RND transporter permease subunit [Spirochaetia bacterium]|jgi:HAE1 family hydrophobic/amphiphilic exporter-1|nr:efflux RND transporter permease subunit [Spirochaetia bacterium]